MVADAGEPGQENPHPVHIEFNREGGRSKSFFAGPVTVITFGSAQYQWHPTKEGGFPDPVGPAVKASINAGRDAVYELPKASMTVIRGTLGSWSTETH